MKYIPTLIFTWAFGFCLTLVSLPILQAQPRKERKEIKFQEPGNEKLLRNRVQDLERRMFYLEQQLDSLNDRTRNLDRRVDDLRSRHV